MVKKITKISIVLFIISLATALLLSITNEFTADIIAAGQLEKKNESMAKVIPAAEYRLVSNEPGSYELYSATIKDKTVGYAVSLSESGYGGDIDMMIGILPDGTVNGVNIIEMSETPGLGDNAKKPAFTDMFNGTKESEIALTKDGGKIEALSGATVTSRAVTKGVKRAVEIVNTEITGGESGE